MRDLTLSVLVSRTALGLDDLEINDHLNYYVGPTLFGGQVQWNRTQVTSPFTDGAFTAYRTRQQVQEQVLVEVLGDSPAELRANLDALLNAVVQDSFTVTITVAGQAYQYQCEAAEYQNSWTGPRLIGQQLQVALTIPRQPVALIGVA